MYCPDVFVKMGQNQDREQQPESSPDLRMKHTHTCCLVPQSLSFRSGPSLKSYDSFKKSVLNRTWLPNTSSFVTHHFRGICRAETSIIGVPRFISFTIPS